MKNILLINSRAQDCDLFTDLFFELKNNDYRLFFLTGPLPEIIETSLANAGEGLDKTGFGPLLDYRLRLNSTSRFHAWLFIFLLPWRYLRFGLKIIYYKFIKKINTILCFHLNEKIICSPLARLLGIGVVWLEMPDTDYARLPGLIKHACRAAGTRAAIINFNKATSAKMKKIGLTAETSIQINPGIKLKAYKHQESIFDSLAQKDYERINHKFFTVGTIIDSRSHYGLECLFRAAEKSLSAIPNLQLVIVGAGSDNKNLNWLARQIGVADIVWLVGRQEHLKKWLLNFNVYVVTEAEPGFSGIMHLLRAMESSLPIVLPRSLALEEYVKNSQVGLFAEIDNSDSLANRLIELKRNTQLRKRLGQSAYEHLLENYTLDNMVRQLIDVF